MLQESDLVARPAAKRMGVANVVFTFGVNSAEVLQIPLRLREPSLSGKSFPKLCEAEHHFPRPS
jgi:hypothetical protein